MLEVSILKKKIIITIVLIFSFISLFIGFNVYKDLKEENVLNKEVDKIIESNFENIEDVKTSLKYGEVEKEVKNYLNEYKKESTEIINNLSNNEYMEVLKIENLQKDMPEFNNSFAKVSNLKKSIEEGKTFLKKEKDVTFDEKYYQNLYKKIIEREEIVAYIEENNKIINDYIDKLEPLVTIYENALNFLKTNKGNYEISNGNLYFYNTDLANKYNEIIGG